MSTARRPLALGVAASLSLLAAGAVSAAPPTGWPATIKTPYGFNELGKGLAKRPDFPRTGSDLDKARYIFAKLPDIAATYDLRTADGGLSNVGVGASRFGSDPENADPLKTKGYGNCGEWSWAFHEVLNGANVTSRVVFGDKQGSSWLRTPGFGGTDTTLIVEERTPRGEISRRVFDAFRAGFHDDDGRFSRTGRPTPGTVQYWGDRPLTDDDILPRDAGRGSWQKLSCINKPYIKDGITQAVLDPVAPRFRVRHDDPADAAPPAAHAGYARGRQLGRATKVPANKTDPTDTGAVLAKGKPYIVVGGGTCSLWNGQEDGCDPVFRYKSPLEAKGGPQVIWGQLKLVDPTAHLSDLIKKETGKDPAYHPNHVYEAVVTGEGKSLKAVVFDGGGYGDNHGGLTVSVFEAVPQARRPGR